MQESQRVSKRGEAPRLRYSSSFLLRSLADRGFGTGRLIPAVLCKISAARFQRGVRAVADDGQRFAASRLHFRLDPGTSFKDGETLTFFEPVAQRCIFEF